MCQGNNYKRKKFREKKKIGGYINICIYINKGYEYIYIHVNEIYILK